MARSTSATKSRRNRIWTRQALGRILLLVLAAGCAVFNGTARASAANNLRGDPMTAGAKQQIQSLLAEKASRTATERKLSSRLLYALKQSRNQGVAAGISALQTGVEAGATIEVDITANVSAALLSRLKSRGIVVLDVVARFRSIRARVPLDQLEAIAGDVDVKYVQPKQEALSVSASARASHAAASKSSVRDPGFAERAARVRAQVSTAFPTLNRRTVQQPASPAAGPINSEGDTTHRADLVRTQLGVDGSGVGVCVLSDGVDALATEQAKGELPAVTVLPGQAGSGSEGTAMLEIVHDVAPGAQLFFAGVGGAGGTIARFAQDILDLRANYGCDIMVDDISYLAESPFQKGQAPAVVSPTNGGVVTEAINTVTAQGALFFSSAGNSGNLNDNQSGTWEGDFADGGASPGLIGPGRLLDFDPGTGVTAYNTIPQDASNTAFLFWSDPLGGSANDYDLFVLDPTASIVLAASTDFQNGTQDPIEAVVGPALMPRNRLVVLRNPGAATRYLHLRTNGGRLTFGTAGASFGHNAAESAFSVAATPAARSAGPPPNPVGPFPSQFSAGNAVEIFSSDGPRHVFYNADGTPITPGNVLSGGGQLLAKPDATAADGVRTGLARFDPFFGTSAAAPHAAAIAALVKSKTPSLTATQIRNNMLAAAIDIEALGADRDSGAGIVDAYLAVNGWQPVPAQPPSPSPSLPPSPSPSPVPSPAALRTFVPLSVR